MDVVVCKDPQDLARRASDWCQTMVRQHKARQMYVPAGRTPEPVYALWEQQRPQFLNQMTLVQIDEILGVAEAKSFRSFFGKHLPAYQSQFEWMTDGTTQAPLAILGLGLNGHIGFHEPELPPDLFSGCVRLSSTTCSNLELREGSWGVTYGLAAFQQARAVLMIVTGANKKIVVEELLQADCPWPTAELKRHPGFTLMVDQAAQP